MSLDITEKYFSQQNKKMYREKIGDSSDIKKPFLTSTPIDDPCSKYIDDSGYASPPCHTITPLNLNDHSYQETILTEKSLDHESYITQYPLDWQEPEEEDVLGKKLLRRSHDGIFVKPFDTINITKILEKHNTSNVIGKKIGRQNCDIVSELDKRNISAFLTQLVSYLSPEDVHTMHNVSKRWRTVCGKISQAYIKLKKFQERKKFQTVKNKENLRPRLEINLKPVTKSELFQQHAASLLNDQHLQKCPECQYPAKVYLVADKGICTNNACNHQYCSKCRAIYHGSASCVMIGIKRLPKEILNTKKAKKFLKRL